MAKSKKLFAGIGIKLTIMLSSASVIAILLTGFFSVNSAKKVIEEQKFIKLQTVGHLKIIAIKEFLERKFRDLAVLSNSQNVQSAYIKLKDYHDNGGTTTAGAINTQTSRYNEIYAEIDPFFRTYLKAYNFHDLFFICAAHGHVLYSVAGEEDLGTNLSKGKYKDSGLGDLWKKVTETRQPAMVDFSYYEPSKENAAFIASPVFNESGAMIAILALQLSTERIDAIMNENTGMGETGETYLVGNDYLMRSDSRFEKESAILKTKVETESVKKGLNNEEGYGIIEDYKGTKVLSYYAHLGLDERFNTDFEWVLLAEIDEQEAFEGIGALVFRITLIGLFLVVLSSILAFLSSRQFTKPIIELERVTHALAKGDLTIDINVDTNDEIGHLANSYRQMQKNMKLQMEEITEGINVLSSSSSEIMAMVSQLASSSAETATSISQTTTTAEEVKQTVEVSNQRANEVADSGQRRTLVSIEGKQSVDETIVSMQKIKQQMENIAGIVIQLSEKSNTIGEIANNVNDLAEQSNLLAVNASIEAAKAGEHGKGFSVVAQEIKNLAQRSKDSTSQIRQILTDIQKEINSAVLATENGSKVIDAGMEQASSTSQVISTLAASVEEAAQANMQIAASNQQQLVGMDQITSAMENIKEASSQASEGIQQAEESVVELNKLGARLLQVIDFYKLK